MRWVPKKTTTYVLYTYRSTNGSNRHPSVQPEIFEGVVPHFVAVPTEREVRRSNLAKSCPRSMPSPAEPQYQRFSASL